MAQPPSKRLKSVDKDPQLQSLSKFRCQLMAAMSPGSLQGSRIASTVRCLAGIEIPATCLKLFEMATEVFVAQVDEQAHHRVFMANGTSLCVSSRLLKLKTRTQSDHPSCAQGQMQLNKFHSLPFGVHEAFEIKLSVQVSVPSAAFSWSESQARNGGSSPACHLCRCCQCNANGF